MSSLTPLERMLLFTLFVLNTGPKSLVVSSQTKPSRVELDYNGYTGVLVAIHEDVPERAELVSAIEAMFTDASRYIYQATKHRAFFRNVTIVVPRAWASNSQYASHAGGHDYDVLVAPTNQYWAPDPYTNQHQGCGQPGVSIRMGEDFLTDPLVEDYYGSLGRLFVHEWGHYRWGLFDEYPDPVTDPDVTDDFYFSVETQKFHGISYASRALKFDPENNRYWACAGNDSVGYEEGCAHVTIDDEAATESLASVMYGRQFYDKIVHFCDADGNQTSTLHDREAPSRHNRLCGARSGWEVMEEHEDFKDDINPPRDVDADELLPTFSVVQAHDKRVVLLIDTSRSMQYDNRFTSLHSAAAHFIQSVAEIGSHVGIVAYNQVAHVSSWLVEMRSDSDRQTLLASLPVVSSNSSSYYGHGLLTSLRVLSASGTESAAGGIVLMFADGVDSDETSTEQVVAELVDKGVTVDTVAGAPNPKTLPDIAAKTGGRSYHSQSTENGLASVLYYAFAGLIVRGDADSDTNRRIMISSRAAELAASEEQSWPFTLDDSLGHKTEILFTWVEHDSFDIILTSPSGATFDNSYPGYHNMTEFNILIISIQGKAEIGLWEVRVRNLLSSTVLLTCIVTSYARSDDAEPIVVTPTLSSYKIDVASGERLGIFAEIRQGLRPVVGVDVVATIYPPGGHAKRVVPLLDNGAGADVRKDDGVYSRYYVTQPRLDGFNTVQIAVTGGPNTTVLNSTAQPRTVPNISPDKYAEHPKIGHFTIFAPGTQPRGVYGTPAVNLSREVSGFTALFDNFPASSDDVTPPCRVHDLRAFAAARLGDKVTFELSWTAPGDDADYGTAFKYDIRYADNVSTFVDDFNVATLMSQSDVIKGNLTKPRPAMNEEHFIVRLPLDRNVMTSSTTFALRAADEGGRYGEMSNVARATFRAFVPEPALPGTTESTPTSSRVKTTFKAVSTEQYTPTSTATVTATPISVQRTLNGGTSTQPSLTDGRTPSVTQTKGSVTNYIPLNTGQSTTFTTSGTLRRVEVAAVAVGTVLGLGVLVGVLGLVAWKLSLRGRCKAARAVNGTGSSDELQPKGLPLEDGPVFNRLISSSSAQTTQTDSSF